MSSKEMAPQSSESIDGLLRVLVNLANTQGLSMGITLHVNGTVIMGELVGAAEYFTGIADMLETKGNPGNQAAVGALNGMMTVFRGFAGEEIKLREKTWDRLRSKEDNEDEDESPLPLHIHLKNARTIYGVGSIIPHEWWRGHLGVVNGWSFGEINFS